MMPSQDVESLAMQQPKKAEEAAKSSQEESQQQEGQMDHHMEHQLEGEIPMHEQIPPQQLLLQCQVCAGLSVLSSDQIQPGAEIGCGFCGSPSVIIQDTAVPPSLPVDYQTYQPPVDLFSSMSLDDSAMADMMMNMSINDASNPRTIFDPSLQLESAAMMAAQQQQQQYADQIANQMFQQTMMPTADHNNNDNGLLNNNNNEGVNTADSVEADTEASVARGRRRTHSPALENEMKRRSWVVSNLREQHEEFMRQLEQEEKAEEEAIRRSQEHSPDPDSKESALKAAADKLTGGNSNSADSSGGVNGGQTNGDDQQQHQQQQPPMMNDLIGTMMAMRRQMEASEQVQNMVDERYRYADADDQDDNMMVDAHDATTAGGGGGANGRGGQDSSEDELQVFATPEQAEQMRRRRQELKKDEKERERARRWRMSGMGSLGVDRRSMGSVSAVG